MQRIECNVQTGDQTVIALTPQEEAEAQARTAAEVEFNSLDNRAGRVVDAIDRLQFEHLFDLENRTRVVESRPQITRAQYRTALIERWKQLQS